MSPYERPDIVRVRNSSGAEFVITLEEWDRVKGNSTNPLTIVDAVEEPVKEEAEPTIEDVMALPPVGDEVAELAAITRPAEHNVGRKEPPKPKDDGLMTGLGREPKHQKTRGPYQKGKKNA